MVDPSRLLLLHGDILECSAWGDADLVLMNSTLFSHSLMARIEARATQLLRPGEAGRLCAVGGRHGL